MKSHAEVVVIGGDVVGCSVLYHLAKGGWTDIMLIERSELTSGSSWHAAGGFHTLNGDPNVAKLQAYTVQLYKEIEELSGQIAAQWKVIDRMQRKLDTLTERFLSLEEQAAPDVPVTKPPHW